MNKTIPGKFQSYISFGKPILVSSNSIVNSIVSKYGLGYSSRSNDLNKLIRNINKIPNLTETRKKEIYLCSKKVYEQKFEINNITNKLIYILKNTYKNHVKKNLL